MVYTFPIFECIDLEWLGAGQVWRCSCRGTLNARVSLLVPGVTCRGGLEKMLRAMAILRSSVHLCAFLSIYNIYIHIYIIYILWIVINYWMYIHNSIILGYSFKFVGMWNMFSFIAQNQPVHLPDCPTKHGPSNNSLSLRCLFAVSCHFPFQPILIKKCVKRSLNQPDQKKNTLHLQNHPINPAILNKNPSNLLWHGQKLKFITLS